MKRNVFERVAIVTILAGLISVANATDPPHDLPPVRAVASSLGDNIVCYGYDCAGVLDSMAINWQMAMAYDIQSIASEDFVADKAEFCRTLKGVKPASCSYSSPPSAPDTDPNWQPNGCGNTAGVQLAMNIGINVIVPNQFSGDYDSPYAGVSFTAACDTHDKCYGLGFDKANCDLDFRETMITKCSAAAADYNVCVGLAGIYHGAVASTGAGQDAYNQAENEHICAVWIKDMKVNGCSP